MRKGRDAVSRTTAIALGGALLLVVLAATLAGRERGGGVPQLEAEPVVHLVDKEAGTTRQLSMEEYLAGVVAGEMGRLPTVDGEAQDWPQAAYEAQTILARSFALSFLTREGPVIISTDVEEAQAYAPENVTPAIRRAVEATRGVVMAHQGGFVKAWFHSYSGGHTATAAEGLNYTKGEPGFIRARAVPENEYVPDDLRSWTASIPLATVSTALEARGINVGQVRSVAVGEWGPSGRATRIDITGTAGTQSIHAADFRVAVGSEQMKSTKLERLEVRGDQLVMSGTGFGHGVGLSQWDAYKLAREGRSAEEILHFFFRDITIGRAWQ